MSGISFDTNTLLKGVNGYSFVPDSLQNKTKAVSTTGVFEDFFNAAVGVLDKTSQYELQAQQLQLDYITGRTDDMLSVQLAEQRAYTALNFTVQVTNKIIDSYKQIMAMQI